MIKTKIPSWMPEEMAARLKRPAARNQITYVFSKGERQVMRRPKPMKPSDWAGQNVVLTDEGESQGRLWNRTKTPQMAAIMDAMDHPAVESGILMKCVQSAGSTAAHNLVGYWADRKPGPVLYVYPDQPQGKKQLDERVVPMFKKSPRLRRHLTGRQDDSKGNTFRLQHTSISIAWAHSPSSLASNPMRYVIFDEVDKYPMFASKREADPISLGKMRMTTYQRRRRSKDFMLSTPTIEAAPINQAYEKAQVRFAWYARCPFCERHHIMQLDHIKWEGGGDANPDDVNAYDLAWYECPHCGKVWNDDVRDKAVRAGEYRSVTERPLELFRYLDTFKPKTIAFRMPAWESQFVTLSKTAAAFIAGQRSKAELRTYMNQFAALPWKTVVSQNKAEDILKSRCKLPPQMVPASAVALTCWVDRQKVGFPYVVRAWARDSTSWEVDYGELTTWDAVEELLFESWWPVEGTDVKMRIWRAGIDLGGGRDGDGDMSMTEETVMWLQRNMWGVRGCKVWGTKGSSNPLPTMLKLGPPQTRTSSGKPLRRAFKGVLLDTTKFKDLFFERLELAQAGRTGGAYLHEKTGMDYAEQIVAEVKEVDDKGVEVWVKKRKDNHWLDCEVGCAALAHWEWPGGGVHLLPKPDWAPQKIELPETLSETGGGE